MKNKKCKKKYKKKCMIFLTVVGLLVAYLGTNIWTSSHCLVVNQFAYETDAAVGMVRLAVLSDLHEHEFGEKNADLIKNVEKQAPDLILLDGDFLNEDSENSDILCELITALQEMAPVYFALGNHEEMYMESHPELIGELEAVGAKVLDKEYVDLEIHGTALRLGGMYDYAFGLNEKDEAEAAPAEVKTFLEDYQNTDRIKIMMAHRPDSFIFGNASEYWDVDLVISGHNHGGQVVLPFLGGIYGGDQGWFPEYVHGMYEKDTMTLFVTSGLGSHKQVLPRVNNRPEIAIITVVGK